MLSDVTINMGNQMAKMVTEMGKNDENVIGDDV